MSKETENLRKAEWRRTHREQIRQYERQYRQTERSKQYQQDYQRKWRAKHPEKVRQSSRESARRCRQKLKERVLAYYGNSKLACVVCGESRVACLSIDHINNDGYEHRKRLGKELGEKMYRWLELNNHPGGYQTLCMNCQFIKKDEIRKGKWL